MSTTQLFIVSYDLRNPGREYAPLLARLEHLWRGLRVNQSVWIIRTPGTAVQLRDDLLGFVDANDSVFVAALSGAAAWRTLLASDAKVKAFIEGK